jgi:hypothetical protein
VGWTGGIEPGAETIVTTLTDDISLAAHLEPDETARVVAVINRINCNSSKRRQVRDPP